MSLYDRVRDGNGWFTHAWSPAILFALRWKLHNDYKLFSQSSITLPFLFTLPFKFFYAPVQS